MHSDERASSNIKVFHSNRCLLEARHDWKRNRKKSKRYMLHILRIVGRELLQGSHSS